MTKVSIVEKLNRFSDHWQPHIVGELNGQHVKLVKFKGDFEWHHHTAEDELFLVILGSMRMDFRDEQGIERSIDLGEGEFLIVPHGTEHKPYAEHEAHVLLFEPAATLNTGNVRSRRTIEHPKTI